MNEKLFVNNIIYLRKSKGYTQKQLSEVLCYSDKVISKWERGESIPDVIALSRIADFYQVKLDQLLNLDLSTNRFEKTSTSKRELELNWLKKPSSIFKSTIWIALGLYIVALFLSVLLTSMVLFISSGLGVVIYTVMYELIVHNIIVEAKYKEHRIVLKTTLIKNWLYIDDILVEKYDSLFENSFRLTGKVGTETVKVNLSRFVTTKCNIFVE